MKNSRSNGGTITDTRKHKEETRNLIPGREGEAPQKKGNILGRVGEGTKICVFIEGKVQISGLCTQEYSHQGRDYATPWLRIREKSGNIFIMVCSNNNPYYPEKEGSRVVGKGGGDLVRYE